jgi:hypothetical protein
MKNNDTPISIVVADDHPSVLHGATDVLTSNPDMTVIRYCVLQRRHSGIAGDSPIGADGSCTRLFDARLKRS